MPSGLKNILRFFSGHRILFFVFLFGGIVSITAMVFVVSLLQAIKEQGDYYDDRLKTFSVSLSQPLKAEQLQELWASHEEHIKPIDVILNEGECYTRYPSTTDTRPRVGRYFTKDTFSQQKLEAFAPSWGESTYKVGDSVRLMGKEYHIVGLSGGMSTLMEVPYETVEELENADGLLIYFEELPTSRQIAEFTDDLKRQFDGAAISPPKQPEAGVDAGFGRDGLICLVICLSALLNLSYLYLYFLQQRRQEFVIYRICGCSYKRLITGCLWEVTLLALVQWSISCLLYGLILAPVFENLTDRLYHPGIAEYLFVLVIYLFVALLVFLPTVIKFLRNSLAQLEGRRN